MPDWKSLVRERLKPLRLKAAKESALSEDSYENDDLAVHSSRSATIGSTRAARAAGT